MSDRLADILRSTTLNGIDFVEVVSADQRQLRVHFLNAVGVAGTLTGQAPVTISGGEAIPEVPLAPLGPADWTVDDEGRPLLALSTPFAGDFSTYQLTIASSVLDPYYATSRFSFKARCPSDIDCAPPCLCCRPEPTTGPAIDYLSKDFESFKRSLRDYSATAYPDWVESSEADLGTVLLELIASVGDDLSYTQDRIAVEATLPTTTQRRSVIRHARLVDYEPRPATSARVTVQLDVADTTHSLPPGALMQAPAPDGGRIFFELGPGMIAPATGELDTTPLLVDARWNRLDVTGSPQLSPYWWDDGARCLLAGATRTWIQGHGHGLVAGDPQLGTLGTALLIDTSAPSAIDAPIREVIHLTGVLEMTDPLYGTELTQLDWSSSEALLSDHDLTRTLLAGNLLPASEGRRFVERFAIEPAAGPSAPAAVVRAGPQRCCETAPIYMHTLSGGRLAWLAPEAGPSTASLPDAPDLPLPEVAVTQMPSLPGDPPQPWRWRRRLLDAPRFEDAFTVDPVAFVDVWAGSAPSLGSPLWEYDGDGGDSVRFGDGDFGTRPPAGAEFEVTYRVTRGSAGNVGADTIAIVDPAGSGEVLRVTNPFPAWGGADEETLDAVRHRAPYAFRALKLRAVRGEDYDEAAEQLPWVLDAGTAFRWTGSWLTVFTTAQPRGAEVAPVAEVVSLVEVLNRRRLAGYEAYTPAPRYVGIDLIVTVCAARTALVGEVEAAVSTELGTGRRRDGGAAFFSPDQFRFGTPLERSRLEIAVQRAPGVDGVLAIGYRRRGLVPSFQPMPETVTVAANEILRVDNDPSEPERGSLRVVVRGASDQLRL